MIPISVMPICTVERKRPGSEVSSSAATAPLLPLRARFSRRGFRAETTAISDMAKTPLIAINARMIKTSLHGKGAIRALEAGSGIVECRYGTDRG